MMPTTSLPSAVLANLLAQGTRLIAIDAPLAEANLVVERLTAREAVSQPFLIELDCLSPSAALDTVELARQEITLRLMLADGRYRAWHGFVVDCASLGGDGGLARYRLTVAPWLERLRGRLDCFVYQDKTTQQILEEVFADYPAANFQFAISQPLRRRSICAQYRESDFDFVHRLLAEDGLSYRFEHLQGEDDKPDGNQARHRLVVFDNDAERPSCPQPEIRFHRADMTEASDTMTGWTSCHSVGSNAVTVSSWDYKTLSALSAQVTATAVPGELPTLESFDGRGAYRFEDGAGATRQATRRMQAEESGFVRWHGEGTVRQLAAGQRFRLTGHFADEATEYVALSIRHEAANNLGADVARLIGTTQIEAGGYRNTVEAVRADAPIAPRWRAKPTAPEGQTAIVIAEGDAPLLTDRDHRVRIRFPWLRAPLPAGQAPAFADPDSDDRSQATAWVRVAGATAGPNWGAHHVPRVGTELLLTFLDGDIDRPLATTQLHNQQDNPPWPNDDKPLATLLSGWHTEGLGGNGYNQWVVDDTKGQLRMRLASSAADSQLNLGYLVAQGPRDAQRGAWRGSGAELRTDAWAIVRAGQGVLLSTTVRPRAGGTVMGVPEATRLLRGAQRTAERLSTAARTQHAAPLAANAAFDPLLSAIDPELGGHHPDSVNGQRAVQPDGNPVERFAEPLLVAESPMAITIASAETTAVYAGRHLHGTSQSDLHVAAGKTIAMAAARGVSLFVQRDGARVVAANGAVSVQAHDGPMRVLADKDVLVTSSNDAIEILAQKTIVLHGGDSLIRLEGNAITFETPGLFEVKGASHAFSGPGGNAAPLAALPTGATALDHWIEIDHRDAEGEPFAGQAYKIHFKDGQVISGKLDANGHARHEGVPPEAVRVEYEMPPPGEDKPWDPIANLIQASRSKLG
ncbi:type VI secretion system Vgr family protein [Cupriavidus sp. AU9028]|uniref:type VI secretion system Vgr family protein n=1 Tax=Cupriavidus sp. AU9028 TaxID=2871157 RepID=UPI001C94B792|nr:type VI secretion system Vgr family protein [Cupriavidus sp. AU9028]MBY4897523.1 type VI secretion system tip protein VgrG [Cupriavidus sp. AU9028]